MDAAADRPQIGHIDVDRAALSEPGAELGVVLGSLEFEVSNAGIPDGTPMHGWRVLARPGYAAVLGTPVDDGSTWRIAQVAPPRDGSTIARVQVHPEAHALRPSRAERSRGLVLRWPEATRSEPDLDRLAVDVVNTGDRRWRPDGDSFVAIGFVTRPGERPGSGYFGFNGPPPAFALDAGEYARVSVTIDSSQWRDLEPGWHEVSATLVDLGVRTEAPLVVELTAAQIEQHRPRTDQARPHAPDHRRMMEQRLEMLHAVLGASDRLGAVLETVRAARSDAEALLGIRELLDCTPDAARAVFETSLRRFRPESVDRLAEEAEELRRTIERAAPGEASDAD